MTNPVQASGPGKAGYVIGAVLLAAGIIGGSALIALGAYSVVDRVNGFQRVSARSGGIVEFSKTGRYNAFYEVNGVKSRSDLPPLQLELRKVDGGQSVITVGRGSGADEHYDFGDHEGVRISGFDVDQPGRYEVRVLGEPGASGVTGAAEIAFGRGGVARAVVEIVIGVLVGGLLSLIGIILLIVTAVRRGRHRKQATYAGYGGYGPPGQPPLGSPWPAPPGGASPQTPGGAAQWPPSGPSNVQGPPPGPAERLSAAPPPAPPPAETGDTGDTGAQPPRGQPGEPTDDDAPGWGAPPS